MLALHVLGSGSKGNAAIVEDVASGRGVAIDCGLCKRDFMGRAREAGFDPARLDAVLLTHDHADHVKGLGPVMRGLAKQTGSTPDLFALREVALASSEVRKLEGLCDVRTLRLDEPFSFGDITVVPFRTSHDAAASCGFRIEGADGDVVGYATDTGLVTDEAHEALSGARVLAIEANHDVKMLREGPYPYALKRRVGGDLGHLSNDQAAVELERLLTSRLECVVGMHLSENNNLPSLARRALGEVLGRNAHGARLETAAQHMLLSVR